MGQARYAGPGVVDGQPRAHGAQRLHARAEAGVVQHRGVLGELQHHPGRPGQGQQLGQPGTGHGLGAYVDRHGDTRGQLGDRPQRPPHCQELELDAEAGQVGLAEALVGGPGGLGGEPGQRLDGHDPALDDVDHGLERHGQPPGVVEQGLRAATGVQARRRLRVEHVQHEPAHRQLLGCRRTFVPERHGQHVGGQVVPHHGQVVGQADRDAEEVGQAAQQCHVGRSKGAGPARVDGHHPERHALAPEGDEDARAHTQASGHLCRGVRVEGQVVGPQHPTGPQGQARQAGTEVDGVPDVAGHVTRAAHQAQVVAVPEAHKHSLGAGQESQGVVRHPLHEP